MCTVRHVFLGATFVLLLVADLWCFVWVFVGFIGLSNHEPGESVWVPGASVGIALFAMLLWMTVRVTRRVLANVRRHSGEFR